MLAPILVSQRVVQRAWVPRAVAVVRESVIGSPSSLVSELRAVLNEDVPLPPPDSGYNAGFLVTQDGFSFRNYGTRYPQGNLTITEVRELFGDGVCAGIEAGNCIPTPAAQLWVDAMNDFMADGHCAGFSIASYRFFDDQLEQAQFTPDARNTFAIERNVPSMRQIARDWVLQTAEEVWQGRTGGTPRHIIDELLARREPVDIGIFGRKGGGHSMLAYGVENMGDGIYHILVYDNNWPGQELFVEVDYPANTWRYSLAATNPGQDPNAWEGNDRTNSLIFIPFDLYNQKMTCPFCSPAPNTRSSELTFVALSGDDGLLQVTDPANQQLGHFGEGEFINTIPGAELVRLKDAMYNNREPLLFMPPASDFAVQIKPRPGKSSVKANLRIAGPEMAFALEGVVVQAGQADALSISSADGSVSYSPSGDVRPVIKLVVQLAGAPAMVVISGLDMTVGQTLNVALDPQTGQLTLGGDGLTDLEVSVAVVKFEAQGPVIFANDGAPLAGNGTVALNVGGWAGQGPMDVTVDQDGDGSFESESTLADEPLSEVLNDVQSADEIIGAVGDMAPYMDEAETESLLEGLAGLAQEGILDGDQLGQVVADMNALNLSNEQLVELVAESGLPVAELADFISEMSLPPEAVDQLVDDMAAGLNLSPADVAALQEEIAAQQEIDALLDEAEFQNFQTPEELGQFLAEQTITPAQMGNLFEELNLPPAELGEVLLNINLSPAALDDVLTELNLPPADVAVVSTLIGGNVAGGAEPAGSDATAPAGSDATAPVAVTQPATNPPAPPPNTTVPVTTVPAPNPPAEPPPPNPPPDTGGDSGGGGSTPSNQAPTAVNDSAITDIGNPVTINVLANDSDPDGNSISIVSISAAFSGTAIAGSNAIIYTPNPGYVGKDAFSYTISDGKLTGSATVSVTVNGPPVAVSDSAATAQEVSVTIGVLGNDSDPNGDNLNLTAVGPAANGTTGISGSSASYTPNPGFFGSDVFTYTVSDGRLGHGAVVTVTVNGAPVAVNDVATTTEELPVLIPVLANDTDPENDPLTIFALNPAGNGAVTISDTRVLYTPGPDFVGIDTFIYQMTDGHLVRSGRVTVTVLNQNDPPTAVNDTGITNEDTPLLLDVLTNDTDPDGDTLSLSAVGPAGNGQTALSGSTVSYTPTLNFNGIDVFTYTITDGSLFDTATVTMIVNPVNDDPPVAVADVITTPVDTPVNIAVLANDTDPDNDLLSVVTVGAAITGTTSFFSGSTTISYFPASGFSGIDVFTYTITDGTLFDTGVVTVGVGVISITGLSAFEPDRSPQRLYLPLITKQR